MGVVSGVIAGVVWGIVVGEEVEGRTDVVGTVVTGRLGLAEVHPKVVEGFPEVVGNLEVSAKESVVGVGNEVVICSLAVVCISV
ncbi:MAG: hypothetical protein J6R82_01580 [Clostridia bacterium]|nr:hypothetical protein [Clostridia bacterium]